MRVDTKYKFKVWDYGDDTWIDPDMFSLGGKMLFVPFREVGFRFILSSGLKDRKGHEIYEGDILKHEPEGSEEEINEVYFENGVFWGRGPLYEEAKNSKIIGNIFENPELL